MSKDVREALRSCPEFMQSLIDFNTNRAGPSEVIDAVLSALQGAGKLQEWRDIATAPRDGRFYLFAWVEAPDFPPSVLCWDARYGCWKTETDDPANETCAYAPTHWQPLPAPPVVTSGVIPDATVAPAPTPDTRER